jgi:hypothetical protein
MAGAGSSDLTVAGVKVFASGPSRAPIRLAFDLGRATGGLMDGGIQRIARSSDSVLQRTRDVATAHSPDAFAASAFPEIFYIHSEISECESPGSKRARAARARSHPDYYWIETLVSDAS